MKTNKFTFIILIIAIFLTGCAEFSGRGPDKEPWSEKPKEEWPSIAFVNKIQYKDTLYDNAGCGFVVLHDSISFCVTAKHVISYLNMLGFDFKEQFRSWEMYVKNETSVSVTAGQLINTRIEAIEDIPVGEDYAVFTLKSSSKDVYKLQIRTKPLKKGERIYAVGWTYDDVNCPQVVYPGSCFQQNRDHFLFSLQGRDTWGGLSGAPVIDQDGLLVGIVSTGVGKLQRSPSVAYLIKQIERLKTLQPNRIK